MRKLNAALMVLLVASPAFADAYRWVDSNGVVHYSDRPVEGAERIELDVRSTPASAAQSRSPARATTPNAATPTRQAAASQQTEQTTGYQTLEIVRPLLGETLWNIGSVLTVSMRSSPALQSGHRVQLIYDGQRRADLVSADLDIVVNNVYRGEHTLQAEILDGNGNAIIQSRTKRFYVQQSSIQR